MVQINQEVPIQAQPAIASYDFTDISSGTGIVVFYALKTKADDTVGRILSKNYIEPYDSGSGSADQDYDSQPFDLPQTVKGTALISAIFSVDGENSVTFQIKRVRDGTETNISSAIKLTARGSRRFLLGEFPLTETSFKNGDILRLSLTNMSDQLGLTDANNPLQLYLPFRIDIS